MKNEELVLLECDCTCGTICPQGREGIETKCKIMVDKVNLLGFLTLYERLLAYHAVKSYAYALEITLRNGPMTITTEIENPIQGGELLSAALVLRDKLYAS